MESYPQESGAEGAVTMQEVYECCPYITRMGVCLEPSACSLKHKTMNLNAKEFVPGQSSMSMEGQEFDPNQ
jgi:hypothetical protein